MVWLQEAKERASKKLEVQALLHSQQLLRSVFHAALFQLFLVTLVLTERLAGSLIYLEVGDRLFQVKDAHPASDVHTVLRDSLTHKDLGSLRLHTAR